MTRYANILETIGRTPVVRINKLAPEGIELWVKMESFNPLGSVKDRLALGVIEAAEKSGALKPGVGDGVSVTVSAALSAELLLPTFSAAVWVAPILTAMPNPPAIGATPNSTSCRPGAAGLRPG